MAEDAEAAESALRENINRKGSNSYYYAHGATATGPAWDGKEQPRLLATSIQPTTVKKVPTNSFDSYSWVDEVKNVKVYIDFENASDIADEAISLVCIAAQPIIFISIYILTLTPPFASGAAT
jgi:hypothetical protein